MADSKAPRTCISRFLGPTTTFCRVLWPILSLESATSGKKTRSRCSSVLGSLRIIGLLTMAVFKPGFVEKGMQAL